MSAGAVKAGGVFVEIGADPRAFFRTLNKVNKAMGDMGRSLAGAGAKLGGIGATALAPIAMSMRQFAQFDDAIRMTAAVSGASGEQLQKLNDKARDLGATTSFTAVQVANLMTELGRAGFSPDEINAMTAAVLDLARATGTDATLASGIMAATLRQFGMGANEATRAADVLTKTANSTFNTVESLGEALKYAGPVAKSLGLSLEDTTAILGVLGNVGIQGSEAGTALRRLSVISAGAGEELKQLFNVSNVDAAGNLKPLVDILDEINEATKNMPVAERTKRMAKAFGLLGITSANVLSNSAGGVRELAASLRNAAGTAAKAAKAMDAGLGGSIRITLSAIEGTALAIGDALAPALQKIIDQVGVVFGGLTLFAKANKGVVSTIAQLAAGAVALGGVMTAVGLSLQAASFGFGGILKTLGVLFAPLSAVGSLVTFVGMSFYKAIAGVLAYSTASVASAVASGAAWAVANAPLLILIGLLGAAGAAAIYAMGGFSGIAEAIGGGMNRAAADGMVVLSDLATTATTTFNGIYEAIAAGDLAGAMDVLWAGLYAGWLRGVEALMGAVDPWISTFQNTFTYLGTEVAVAWENLWTSLAKILAINGAIIQGALDNLFNGIAVTFDNIEATASKALNLAQKAANPFMNLQEANAKVDAEMKDRADKRERERPGLKGRLAQAEQDNIERQAKSDERVQAMRDAADQTAQGREDKNAQRRDERRAATQAAEANLESVSGAVTAKSQDAATASELLKSLESASSLDEITNIGTSIDALMQRGNISGGVEQKLMDAYYAAFSRVNVASASTSGMESQQQVESGAAAAGLGGPSQAQVVGTFSSVGLGGLGFGSSLAQKQLDVMKKIEENTRDEGLVQD